MWKIKRCFLKIKIMVHLSHFSDISFKDFYKKYVDTPRPLRQLISALVQTAMEFKLVDREVCKKIRGICRDKLGLYLDGLRLSYKHTKSEEMIKVTVAYQYSNLLTFAQEQVEKNLKKQAEKNLKRQTEEDLEKQAELRVLVPILLSAVNTEIPDECKDRLVVNLVNHLPKDTYRSIEKWLKENQGIDIEIREMVAKQV